MDTNMQTFWVEIRDGEHEYGHYVQAKVMPDQCPDEVADAIAAFHCLDWDEAIGHYPASSGSDAWEERGDYRHIKVYPNPVDPLPDHSPTSARIHWARVAKHPADVDPNEIYGPVSPVVLYAPKKRDLPRRMKVWVSTAVPEGDRHFLAMQAVNNKYGKAFG